MQRAPRSDLLRGGRMAVSWDGRAAAFAELRLSIAATAPQSVAGRLLRDSSSAPDLLIKKKVHKMKPKIKCLKWPGQRSSSHSAPDPCPQRGSSP
eukprot:453351-Hanusia_phi.AAC.1